MITERTAVDLKDQLKKFIGSKKAIIGLSGGIDSTVIAYLSVGAIGPANVICVAMPFGCGNDVHTEDGRAIAKMLKVRCDVINIEPIVSTFPVLDDAIPNHLSPNLVQGNIRARVRMVLLYQYSNRYDGMVIGTTNKTEAEIGYYTKYGDGAVDVEPIADLYKGEVRELARLLGVPERFVTKVPTANLWEGQTDEDELGVTYDELDEILKVQDGNMAYLRDYGDTSPDGKDLLKKYGDDKIRMVEALIRGSNHKRSMPPAFRAKK